MEVPELTRHASPARDQPAPAPGQPGAPGGQVSPHLTLGPVILPPEQGLAPTVFLKALPIPLYHTVPPGGLQPRAPLVTRSLDGGSVPFILSPLLRPEGPGPTQVGKPAAPALTVNIVGTLPVLSPGVGPTLGSPGKVRNAGKYLCPHCGRDCLKPSVLEKHIRSHTGERPFPCATCGIAFKTQSNLYKHRRTQTHLNHSRLSSESDGGGGSLLEEGEKAGESSRADGMGDSCSQRVGGGARPERPLCPGAQGAGQCSVSAMRLPSVTKTLGLKLEAVPCPGSTFADRETPMDAAAHPASPGLALAGCQPRFKPPEQTSPTASRLCSLQQQQMAMSSEKPWDAKASEGRLRKCESTDSGYLSRSDSAEQPPAPGSPLEHNTVSEGEVALGPGGPGLQLEKKQLEERIAWLISHNQAVVDDSQLDNVRPRKTVLCKQGSIDLPMPYTYKDSFHFDIRALQPSRRRPATVSSARSTFIPPDRARPLFFHSIPTQLSTTVACVPVTRSNSLPFVEGTRTWQELLDPRDACLRRQKPLSPKPAPTRLVDVLSGPPRALVRQAAVEDLLFPPTGDSLAPAEDPDGNKAAAGEGAASKGRAANKKCSQRKLKMFSQDKWQVYGNETFRRIYQKMKTSCHGGKKAKEVTVGSRTELDFPLQEELPGNEGIVSSQDRRYPVHGDAPVGAKPGPCRSSLAPEGFLVIEPPKQREMVTRAGVSDQPGVNRATSPPTFNCREPPCLGSKSPLLSPDERLGLGCQLPPAPGPLKGGDLEAPTPVLPDPELEGGTCDGGGKETCPWTHTVLRRPSGSSGEPQASENKLPSERKKLKVEKLSCQEQSEPPGTETEAPGGPLQATSLPSQNQDSDSGDKPGGLRESTDSVARGRAGQPCKPLEVCGASAAPSVAPRQVGLREEILPHPAAPSHLAAQSRASGALTALVDTLFPPKYLLRLPQGETHPPASVALGPGQVQDPLCRRRWPEEQTSFVGSGLGTFLPPCPASGLVLGGAQSFEEDPSWSRPWGRNKGVQGKEKGDMDTGTPTAGQSPGSSTGAPREKTSFLPTPTCATRKSGTPDTRHPCMGRTAVGARLSGGVLSPCALSRDLGGSPENVPEDPPSGPLAGLNSCHSFLSAPTPPSWPELASCTHSDTGWSFRAHSPFPSLRAEPRLTWCCLSRSLPLPREQKEKAASVYLALHFLGGSPQDKGPDAQPVSRAMVGGQTRTGLGEGGQVQTSKLSCPVASGMVSQERVSEPEWKKGLPWRKAKMFRGSGKQKLSIRSRRYKGSFLQSRTQRRGSGPRRQLRVLRKDRHLPQLGGLGPHGTPKQPSSEMTGLNLQDKPSRAASELPMGCGQREEEAGPRQTSGSFSPSTSSRAGSGIDEEIFPAAGGHGDRCPQSIAAGSELSEHSDSCVAVANDSLLCQGRGLSMGLLETQPLPSHEQVSVDLKPYIFSDAQEPSSFGSKGTSPCQDVVPCVAAICVPGERAGRATLGIHIVEPQDHRATGEALTQSSPDRKARAEGVSPSVLPGRPSSGQRISGLVLLGSTGKTRLEIPASGPGSASSYQEEGELKTFFPPGGRYGYGEMIIPCPPLGNDSGKCQGSGLTAVKDHVVPSNPGQPRESPEASSKTVKRRGLEGLRKQTRVEVSDTSSDDEDRLVIEM